MIERSLVRKRVALNVPLKCAVSLTEGTAVVVVVVIGGGGVTEEVEVVEEDEAPG